MFLYLLKVQLIWIVVVTVSAYLTLYFRDKLPGDSLSEGLMEVFTTFVAIFIAQFAIAVLVLLFFPFLAASFSLAPNMGGLLIRYTTLFAFIAVYVSATRKQLDFKPGDHAIFVCLSIFFFLLALPLLVIR